MILSARAREPDYVTVEINLRPAQRAYFLSDDELCAVWNALGDDPYGTIIKLLILTGQRRVSTRSRGFSSDALLVPITGLFSTSPSFIAQVKNADAEARARSAATGPGISSPHQLSQ